MLTGDGDEDGGLSLCEDEAIAQEEACDAVFESDDGDDDIPLTDAGEQSSEGGGDSTTTGESSGSDGGESSG